LICEIFFFFSKFCDLLFAFYFFTIFDILFFNFVYFYLSKNSRNFYVFLFYGLEILSKNFGKSWNVFQKNIDIWNLKFFINSIVDYLVFLFFDHFGNVFFLYHLSKLVKKFYTFLWCFIVRIIYFMKEFWKILEFLLKKNRYFKYKRFSEFYRLLFAFLLFW